MDAKRTFTVLFAASLLAVLIISLQWNEAPAATPANTPADAGPAGTEPEHAAPNETATLAPTNTPDERQRIAGSAVLVRGLIRNFESPRAWLSNSTKFLGSAVRKPDGSFEHSCDAPLTSLELRAIASNGAERKRNFTRPESEAWSEWDLGDIDMGGEKVTLRFTLEYDPEVIQRMRACGHTMASVTVTEKSAGSSKLAVVEFGLADLASRSRSSTTQETVVRTARTGVDLTVTWQCLRPHPNGSPIATAITEETLAGDLGPSRTSSLSLVPEQEVRGQVTNMLDAPCRGISVRLANRQREGSTWMSVKTSEDGSFSFHVQPNATGMVELGSSIGFCTGDRPEVPFAAGTIANLRLRVTTIPTRLVDASGAAIDSYRIHSTHQPVFLPWQASRTNHPDGIALATIEGLKLSPLLWFNIGGKPRQLFMVPPSWLDPDDQSVRDVSVTNFAPSSSIKVTRDGDTPTIWGRSWLRFEGKNELDGLQFDIPSPGKGEWLIEDIPVGTYDYSHTKLGERSFEGEIVITSTHRAELHLTHN